MKRKLVTIDEHCGQPEGTFKKYVKDQEDLMRKQEQERKDRIRKRRLLS